MIADETASRATASTMPPVEQPTLIRLALPDRPGGLATVARCLANCGVDILSVEVVGHQGGEAIDDVLVRGGDLDRALVALGGEVRLLGRRTGAELPDPALSIAHHAYVLESGRIKLDGPAAELAQNDVVRQAYLGGA